MRRFFVVCCGVIEVFGTVIGSWLVVMLLAWGMYLIAGWFK